MIILVTNPYKASKFNQINLVYFAYIFFNVNLLHLGIVYLIELIYIWETAENIQQRLKSKLIFLNTSTGTWSVKIDGRSSGNRL